MHKSILVTGVSGSGKSVLCGELEKLGYKAYDIDDVKGLCRMVHKKTGKPIKNQDNTNLEQVRQHDWICNKRKLKSIMRKNPKGMVFYCGSVSNADELLTLFDKIFLLKAHQRVLSKRLSTRTTNDFGRTREVQRWIFDWRKWWENHMIEQGAVIINANQTLRKVATDIIKKSKV